MCPNIADPTAEGYRVGHGSQIGMQDKNDLLSFSMLGMTLLPFFMYDARKPSTEKMISGGRTNLKQQHEKLQTNSVTELALRLVLLSSWNREFLKHTFSEGVSTSLGFRPRDICGNFSAE